jgi:transposase
LGSPDVDSYINGISRDIDAVKNAILHNHNNGPAEGSVNKEARELTRPERAAIRKNVRILRFFF